MDYRNHRFLGGVHGAVHLDACRQGTASWGPGAGSLLSTTAPAYSQFCQQNPKELPGNRKDFDQSNQKET